MGTTQPPPAPGSVAATTICPVGGNPAVLVTGREPLRPLNVFPVVPVNVVERPDPPRHSVPATGPTVGGDELVVHVVDPVLSVFVLPSIIHWAQGFAGW